jgi:nicotinamidase/pyrazinamidase
MSVPVPLVQQTNEHDVLVAVDVLNDFMLGGALAVPRGDEIGPLINRLAGGFANLVLTQDWHTPGPCR